MIEIALRNYFDGAFIFLEKFYQLHDLATSENHSEAIFVLHDQLKYSGLAGLGRREEQPLPELCWMGEADMPSACRNRCCLTCWA